MGVSTVIKVQIKQTREAKKKGISLPFYIREGDAGLDLRAVDNIILNPGERCLVKTGLQMAVPANFVGLIKDRSGLAFKKGIHAIAGVIDANYRGEICVVLLNTGKEKFQIKRGDRIAQILIFPIAKVNLEEVDSLEETARNGNAWGSTGEK